MYLANSLSRFSAVRVLVDAFPPLVPFPPLAFPLPLVVPLVAPPLPPLVVPLVAAPLPRVVVPLVATVALAAPLVVVTPPLVFPLPLAFPLGERTSSYEFLLEPPSKGTPPLLPPRTGEVG